MKPDQQADIVRQAASQLLRSVNVCVDQSRQHPPAAQVDPLDILICLRQEVIALSYADNTLIFHQDGSAIKLTALRIHRDDTRVMQQYLVVQNTLTKRITDRLAFDSDVISQMKSAEFFSLPGARYAHTQCLVVIKVDANNNREVLVIVKNIEELQQWFVRSYL